MPASLVELLDRFGESTLESWSDNDWESFTLQALWRVCCEGVRGLPPFTPQPQPEVRHRDLLWEATGVDTDALVHDLLIRFCAAFLDQGMANWTMPRRNEGFYLAFCSLYRTPRGYAGALDARARQGAGPTGRRTHRATRIDPGIARRPGRRPGRVGAFPFGDAPGGFAAGRGWFARSSSAAIVRGLSGARGWSLVEFLAIRLLLGPLRALASFGSHRRLGSGAPVREFWRLARGQFDAHWPPSDEQRAFSIFQLAQVLGLSPDLLQRLSRGEWSTLLEEIETFSGLERRRVFHLAYEDRFTKQTLDAIALHARKTDGRPKAPKFQICCCLDEREESFRRHLEELEPGVETFGAAGFYSVAMYYRGASDAHFVPLCPVVIRPQHWVTEEVDDGLGETHRRRARTRRVLGTASHQSHVGSRSRAPALLLSGVVGVYWRRSRCSRGFFFRGCTRASSVARSATSCELRRAPGFVSGARRSRTGPEDGRMLQGHSVDEMADRGERLLRGHGADLRVRADLPPPGPRLG